ncbi:c-type cytochrome biogenesis protein CcmI [Beijerinckia sp. L45]|uniref:c-type cytochrome biogenesis protein CcmI n=1 Tax=Beijerinckia sp. L45 TaxID=1641855 RepID=UPI00210FD102|nr:c-type cytochrome biogenesis protein CcmI [Beijerinckia sp. L45]
MISLWVLFALLTGVAVFSVLWPLSRALAATDRRELDVAFYKAQAAEIERDASRGIIGSDEADVAKTEAARRLMAAAQRDGGAETRSSQFAVRLVALASLVFVPVMALALYTKVGKPDLPDMPLEARLAVPALQMDMATAIAKIERHLSEEPGDGRGYEVLAPTYMRLGRADDAVRAYTKALELLGPTADRYAGLGEAQVYSGSGVVTADAKRSFEKAFSLDPTLPRANFYLGLSAQQDGDKPKALDIWRKLVAASPPDAPWVPTVKTRIADLAGEPLPDSAPPMAGAGQAVDGQSKMAAAIQKLPGDQQQAMIHRMVDGLADRLKENGADLDGWLRLVRAYRVLDEQDKAKGALADARRNFASDTEAKKRIDALAHELGLEG